MFSRSSCSICRQLLGTCQHRPDPYLYTGKYQEAIRALDKAIKLHWQAHDTTFAIRIYLHKALLTTEAWEEAKAHYEESNEKLYKEAQDALNELSSFKRVLQGFRYASKATPEQLAVVMRAIE